MSERADRDEIGRRARVIRRRRGLSLDTAAGLAGISKAHLSMLETGKRRFERRSLLENVAEALGCSVVDLTGQPYLPADRASADVLAAVPGIREAVYDVRLDDAPDEPVRPLRLLAAVVRRGNEARDTAAYGAAGKDISPLLTELHTYVVHHGADERREALRLLVEACHVAGAVAEAAGHQDLALACAVREWEAAKAIDGGDVAALALAGYALGQTWARVGARRQADQVLTEARAVSANVDPDDDDTGPAEMAGMLHLGSALLASRSDHRSTVFDHLGAARELAQRVGERNTALQHFGPTNVALWDLALRVDLGDGVAAAEQAEARPIPVEILGSRLRTGNMSLDLARGWAQAGGRCDDKALRALDAADRSAPAMVRNHPLARELLHELHGRARHRVWELDSLRNRFRIG